MLWHSNDFIKECHHQRPEGEAQWEWLFPCSVWGQHPMTDHAEFFGARLCFKPLGFHVALMVATMDFATIHPQEAAHSDHGREISQGVQGQSLQG